MCARCRSAARRKSPILQIENLPDLLNKSSDVMLATNEYIKTVFA